MIRKLHFLFCDNEHGSGDVTFPNLDAMDAHQTKDEIVKGNSIGLVRKAAKAKGWGRINGADYCPGCMESL